MGISKIGYMLIIGGLLLSSPVYAYPLLSKPIEVIATGYAPLDPSAIKGVCYSGDPTITASGQKTTPGITIAASKDIPFGTWIYLQGLGWRRVDDRGKKITKGKIDICFRTRKEAIEWGRRKIRIRISRYHFNKSEVMFMRKIKNIIQSTLAIE